MEGLLSININEGWTCYLVKPDSWPKEKFMDMVNDYNDNNEATFKCITGGAR